jgi:hypothetical protein
MYLRRIDMFADKDTPIITSLEDPINTELLRKLVGTHNATRIIHGINYHTTKQFSVRTPVNSEGVDLYLLGSSILDVHGWNKHAYKNHWLKYSVDGSFEDRRPRNFGWESFVGLQSYLQKSGLINLK